MRCSRSPRRLIVVAGIFFLCSNVQLIVHAQEPGHIEFANENNARPRLLGADVGVPGGRGAFDFPAPYRTRGVRITTAEDCGGADCVQSVGYSYWRITNYHE